MLLPQLQWVHLHLRHMQCTHLLQLPNPPDIGAQVTILPLLPTPIIKVILITLFQLSPPILLMVVHLPLPQPITLPKPPILHILNTKLQLAPPTSQSTQIPVTSIREQQPLQPLVHLLDIPVVVEVVLAVVKSAPRGAPCMVLNHLPTIPTEELENRISINLSL